MVPRAESAGAEPSLPTRRLDPEPADADHALEQAAAWHQRGVAANSSGHPQAAAEHFRAGLRLLGPRPTSPPAAEQAARLLISLAHAEAQQGNVERGLDLLDQADQLVAARDRGILLSQRALLLLRVGRFKLALPLFDQAIALVADQSDPIDLVKLLLNRGGLYMREMREEAARADLARCERIAREHGAYLQAAKAVHGLGYCELLAGNIPAALDVLARAESEMREHGAGNVAVVQMDRALALMAAGLAHEAVAGLESAIAAFSAQHLAQDQADAELGLAQAVAATGDPVKAAEQARQAVRNFQLCGNETGATLARLTAARADFDRCFGTEGGNGASGVGTDPNSGANIRLAVRGGTGIAAVAGAAAADGAAVTTTAPAADADADGEGGGTGPAAAHLAQRAARLAVRLDRLGLVRDAALARLLSARALLRAGAPPRYVSLRIRAAAPRGVGLPLETRLTGHLARAELAIARGDYASAYAQLRRGLAQLDEYRRMLGSLDLQTGVSALGRELTGTGLQLALAGGSPRAIFAWSERSRAQALRIRPVHPPDNPQTAQDAMRLRYLDRLLRADEGEGRLDPVLRREHAALSRKLLEDSWTTAGPGQTRDSASATLSEVIARLDADGHRMLSLLRHGDRLLALAIAHGRARLVPLGDYHRAAEAARRLVGDLEAYTAGRLPKRLQTVIETSMHRQIAVLTAEILTPLSGQSRLLAEDGAPLVVIPTGALSSVPWTMLPRLREHPLTVCPSAHLWLAAQSTRADSPDGEHDPRPLLVAGPRLAYAEQEIAAIAQCYPAATVLTGAQATVEATLRAMNGAHTVHLAAHGHHERGNVLFARLDLADGPLMAYDLQHLTKPPLRAILSACEVGDADIRSGDEHLGFTTALLHAGTATVIASGARVPDHFASRLMTQLHQTLATGAAPAAALASAASHHPLNTFTCYGAGL
jgi:CHAT domain-containing protein